MKTIQTILLAAALTFTASANVASPKLSKTQTSFVVMDRDVTLYLEENGHEVLTTPVETEVNQWECDTKKSGILYHTIVYTDGDRIVDYEDIMI